MGYDIYPDWTTFVKTVPIPQDPKRKLFAKCQEIAMWNEHLVCSNVEASRDIPFYILVNKTCYTYKKNS